jgi:hypothetical protein
MDTQQMMEILLAMREDMKTNQEKADSIHKEMIAKMNQKRMEANRKTGRKEMKQEIGASQEKMEVAIHSIRSELDETIQHRIENVMTQVNYKTQSLQKELRENLKKTQVKLQTVEVSLDAQARKFQEDLATIKSNHLKDYDLTNTTVHTTIEQTRLAIEAARCEFRARLEVVEAKAKGGRGPGVYASMAQPPIFEGTTSWSVFRRQFETVAEHNHWLQQEKSTYLITALRGQAADVLHGIPINATYQKTLQALEDRFGDQHLAAAYRSQLKARTQRARESLQEFATAIKQLAHRTYPTLPDEHIRREAGKAFTDGVEDPDIKIQLLLGGEKTVNEALRQSCAMELCEVKSEVTNC